MVQKSILLSFAVTQSVSYENWVNKMYYHPQILAFWRTKFGRDNCCVIQLKVSLILRNWKIFEHHITRSLYFLRFYMNEWKIQITNSKKYWFSSRYFCFIFCNSLIEKDGLKLIFDKLRKIQKLKIIKKIVTMTHISVKVFNIF